MGLPNPYEVILSNITRLKGRDRHQITGIDNHGSVQAGPVLTPVLETPDNRSQPAAAPRNRLAACDCGLLSLWGESRLGSFNLAVLLEAHWDESHVYWTLDNPLCKFNDFERLQGREAP